MKYNLTSNLILFRPLLKVEYVYTYEPIFDLKQMLLKLICQEMWVARARVIWFSERRFIDYQRPGKILLDSFFLETGENSLTAHSRIATTIDNQYQPPSRTRASLLEQLQIGGMRKIRTRQISGWWLLSQWRSERSMGRSGREKAEWWGSSWLDGCNT